MTTYVLKAGFEQVLSLFWVVVSLIALFVVGAWGSARKGKAERRDWAGEIVLGGLCAVAMLTVDSILQLHGVFEGSDSPLPGQARGEYASMLLVHLEGTYAACAVMAGAILVAWATASRPAWGPRVPFVLIAGGGVVLLILVMMAVTAVREERTPSVPFRVDQAGLVESLAVVDTWGRRLTLARFLAFPPWQWHGTVDRILALLLPAVAVGSGWAAWRAHRRRETCDAGARGEFRDSVTALGVVLLCLSLMRLTFLAEERIGCLAVYRHFLLTTNGQLFLDWLRVAWFPILAAAAGGWTAWFGWSRFRPAPAEPDASTPAGG